MHLVHAALIVLGALDDYHVSPAGDDANDGRTPAKPWRTVAKVNATTFRPGDRILFARGGEWRESLKASSNGAPGKPVVYAAYGEGSKPRFWGSDVLRNADFKPAAGGRFACPFPARAAAVLVDRRFLPSSAWSWENGALTVDRDPRAVGGVWTACVRVDPVHSNGRNHLVFRDLVADESADARDGYGFRVMGSDDVRLEDCEAYRAGRHHFGTINSTRFTGLRLRCAWAMPNCPGGATFYVSFSDASRKGDSHEWIDCSGEGFENPGQRNYQVFYDHGEGLGPILIRNMTSKGGMLSVGTSAAAPVTIEGGLIEDATLEIFGTHARVNGLSIRGNGGLDHWGSDSLFENLLLILAPKGGGPTGYGAGVLLRDKAKKNTVRFSTIVMESGPCLQVAGRGSETKAYGNVYVSKGAVLAGATDLAMSDWNLLPAGGTFEGKDLAAWRATGFDAHSLQGDPMLSLDFAPKPGSPAIRAAKLEAAFLPATDRAGRKRSTPATLGAVEPGP